jgi:hypothetical protein
MSSYEFEHYTTTMSNRVVPFTEPPAVFEMESSTVAVGVPVYRNHIHNCSKRLLLWSLIPFEIPSGCLHLALCMGFCGKFGNPVTPIIENIPYEVFYAGRFERTFSFFTSTVYGLVHCCIASVTCCGCLGVFYTPATALEECYV